MFFRLRAVGVEAAIIWDYTTKSDRMFRMQHGGGIETMKPRQLLATSLLAIPLSMTACFQGGHLSSDPEPSSGTDGVVSDEYPDVIFVPVGVDPRGCTQYTKRPTREGIAVDAAIWYRDKDGNFVLDASQCEPGYGGR